MSSKSKHSFGDRSRPYVVWNTPMTEYNLRQTGAEELGEAKCPRCCKAMVARMGRRGPYFHCACKDKGNPLKG